MKIVLLLLIPILSFSQINSVDKIEKYMDAQHNVNKFAGTILVVKNDTVLLKNVSLRSKKWYAKKKAISKPLDFKR